MTLDKIAFVDIETTGSSALTDKILEIAIICVNNNKFEKEFSTLVNPQMPFSPFISMMTGIQPDDVISAPTFEDIQGKVLELLKDRLFIAHNVGFDYGFIKQEFKRLGLSFNADRCCTVKLSRHFFPEHRRHNLDSLIERHEFECENRHRAYSDTSVLWQFYQHLSKTHGSDKLLEAIQLVSKRPTLPSHLDSTIMEGLPEKPGVYIFHGDEGIPLYIGKSKNIKERVWQHFALITESDKERDLTSQIKKIDFIETAGELGALLLEAKMVKDMQPVYNRKLRKCEDLIYIVSETNEHGYNIPAIKSSADISLELHSILAVHKTKAQAKKHLESIIDDYKLCRVLLGLERSTSGCFNHKLDKCPGGCVQKESLDNYNERFLYAFSKTKIPSWPYQEAVVINEQDIENRAGENHVFQNWQYLGAIKYTQESTSIDLNHTPTFDYDKYMILKNYLRSHTNIKNITALELEQIRENSI